MMLSSFRLITLIGIVGLLAVQVYCGKKIKLQDLQALTLHADRWTAARRSNPIPELQCVGGSAGYAANALPKVVQCVNTGYDGQTVNWRCEGELDNQYRFGELDVSCEGYDYPDDDYVLVGSCGLRYKLDLTSGESSGWFKSDSGNPEGSSFGGVVGLFVLFFIAYLVWVNCLGPFLRGEFDENAPQAGEPSAPPPPPGFFGGDAPPPYSDTAGTRYRPQPNLYPDLGGAGTSYSSPGWGSGSSYTGSNSRWWKRGAYNATSGQNSGFWSGVAAGGLGGYLFGRATAPSAQQPHSTYTNTQANSWWSSTPSRPSTFSSSSGSRVSGSGSRSAAGFASTSRR